MILLNIGVRSLVLLCSCVAGLGRNLAGSWPPLCCLLRFLFSWISLPAHVHVASPGCKQLVPEKVNNSVKV